MMVQLFVKREHEKRCQDAMRSPRHESLTGLSMNGKAQTVSGHVMSVLPDQAFFPDYPLLVTVDQKNP